MAVLEMRRDSESLYGYSKQSMNPSSACEEEKSSQRKQFRKFLEGRPIKNASGKCPSDDVVATDINRSSDDENDSVG